ncbi:hypothetical protein Ddye_014253 [Dipteronia dyeriana]|uniref:Uncharacterized protein n=1 Tax=Dipteronia dyeriana TaxID=168575 RepID=A0AAD9X7U9_9ROSI|nr:hypothetical protein Ddye_014253 [Dipteronia dyeriana]
MFQVEMLYIMVTNVEEEQQQWRGVGVLGSERRDSNEADNHTKKICFYRFNNLPEFVSRNIAGYAIRIANEAIGEVTCRSSNEVSYSTYTEEHFLCFLFHPNVPSLPDRPPPLTHISAIVNGVLPASHLQKKQDLLRALRNFVIDMDIA